MFSNKKRRRIKPFARPTSFDFNAIFDLRHYQKVKYGANVENALYSSSTSIEDFQIMEGEILMHMDETKKNRRYGDHQMHCFGFATGLTELNETEQKQPVNAALLSANGFVYKPPIQGAKVVLAPVEKRMHALLQLKYAGVSVTGFKPETDIYEQGFVVTVAGLNTIFNNGEHNIYPGDLICADVPKMGKRGSNRSNAQGGIPGTKYQFCVTPYDKMVDELGQGLASKFIMGTAMSFSKKGSPLDVVLHRCNVITTTATTPVPAETQPGGGRPPATAPPAETTSSSSRGRGKGGGGGRGGGRGGGTKQKTIEI